MRTSLVLFALFGFAMNGWLYLRGGWMPGLLIAAIAALLVAFLMPAADDSSRCEER